MTVPDWARRPRLINWLFGLACLTSLAAVGWVWTVPLLLAWWIWAAWRRGETGDQREDGTPRYRWY